MNTTSKNEIEKVILTRESYDELNDDLRGLENENEKLLNKIEIKTNNINKLIIENNKLKEYIVDKMVEDLVYYLELIPLNEVLDRDNIGLRDNWNEIIKLGIDEELFENAMVKKWNEIKETKTNEGNEE